MSEKHKIFIQIFEISIINKLHWVKLVKFRDWSFDIFT